ncbi:MAG: hypothetical protein AAGB13_17550 [Cyanobacteria bacterium P01_F01_bin.33]
MTRDSLQVARGTWGLAVGWQNNAASKYGRSPERVLHVSLTPPSRIPLETYRYLQDWGNQA